MIWGFAGPWYGEFTEKNGRHTKDENEQRYIQLEFLQRYGFKCTGMPLKRFAALEEAERDKLAQYLADHDLCYSAGVGYKYLEADEDECKRQAEEHAALLQTCVPQLRSPICTTGPHAGHRFDREMPVEEKLERLSRALTPLAAACAEIGAPLGIENHCDYYVSDLVELCEMTPNLHIFLDTGNTYMIGEKPLPAFKEAAPYTIGSHFKDHMVCPRPNGRPMNFEVTGAALGDGDVPLRECYEVLQAGAPNPDTLVMEVEMIAPREGMTPIEAMERSVAFIKSLEAGK